MKFIFKYLRPLVPSLCFGMTVKVLATLFELALPYILSHILDRVVPTGEMAYIFGWGAAMIVAALLACIGNIIANRNAAGVARDASRRIRHDLFEATMHLTARETDRFTVPSLESRLTSDTYNVHHFIGMMQRIGVRAPILLLGGMAITLVLDRRLALVLIATLPLIGITVFAITFKGLPLYRENQRAVDGMVRVVREDCQGVRVIKALSKEDFESRRYDAANRNLVAREQKAGVTMALSQPLINLFLNLGLVAVIFVGAYFVNIDLSKPGRIIAFIQYFTLMSGAMTVITRIFVQYTKSVASANRISEVIDTAKAHDKGEPLTQTENTPVDDTRFIEFEGVSFSYNGRKNNLSDISFSLPRGGTLGIIGATGSGKTTLTALLMRFYDADSGEIRIGGKPLSYYDTATLRGMFGVVMQNDFISADTVAENIRFGRTISEESIRRAARLAQAAEFIEAFEDGYEHALTAKGTNLSGGQRQRVLIARALAGDPEILILDDASSALDYKTDANLRRAIREELHTTTVVIAQRVSSVMHADHILVLDHGRVIGAGTHAQLMEQCSAYREISDSQMGGAFLE
ncbi:MAG: ABC transporter ATP-binding protein [Ruminococcaceae bacterium]|nr:ABC transporter ATP-binding protein [Oscillospiraceae bacterium]